MSTNMNQYKDLFVQTAKEYLSTLNDRLLRLEKEPGNSEAIEEIFRAMHSLKGQSAAMGYEQTGYLCHVIEDVFYEVKEKRRKIDPDLADLLFQSLDNLSESVVHIEAEGTELPISTVAEQLKRVTGLQTTGSGHTARQEGGQPVPDNPHATTEPPKAETDNKPTAARPVAHEYMEPKSIKTIPVKVDQLDDIVGSLEELMVNRLTMQSLIHTIGIPALTHVQDKIDGLIEQLQYQVMKIRTVPLSLVLDHFPRAIRDLGRMLNKPIELHVEGADLELDRIIVERLDDPLTHLIRNAADHGLGEKGGTITVKAYAERDSAIVTVRDDGAGVDWQAVAQKAGVDPNDAAATKKALFSGISTAKEVSLVSGRGVGLEAVKKTIEDMSGTIDVKSEAGKGTTFILKLPLTLSVVRTLIVRVNYQRYAIAASAIDRSLRLRSHDIVKSVGQEAFRYEDKEIPIIRLRTIFGEAESTKETPSTIYAVMLHIDGERIAVVVDDISETLETVVRPLPEMLKRSPMFSGVAVIGDGSTVLLINPRGLM